MATRTTYGKKDINILVKKMYVLRLTKTDLFKRDVASRPTIDNVLNKKEINVKVYEKILAVIEKEERKLKKILDGIK